MDHKICLNSNSFPAENAEQAYLLFNDSLQGMLELNRGENDRYLLYLDSVQSYFLEEFPLAGSYTFSDFMSELLANGDVDLHSFLTELEDKSPALDFISENILDSISSYFFYIEGIAALDNPEVLSLAYFLDAILLSINTSEHWSNTEIHILRLTGDGKPILNENLSIQNISCQEHGIELLKKLLQSEDPSILSVNELWERKCEIFSNLRFLDRTKDDLVELKHAGLPYKRALVQCLALDKTIFNWVQAGVDNGKPEYLTDFAEGEHDSRKQLTTWRDIDGQEHYFDKHLYIDKFGYVGRLHFRLCPGEKKAIVAYMGRKLGE